MLGRWNTNDMSWDFMDELRRQMDRALEDFNRGQSVGNPSGVASVYAGTVWPRAWLTDSGSQVVLYAEVPGLDEKDIQLTVQGDSLTLKGERTVSAPEGYTTHRQERSATRFSRTLMIPAKIDPEKVTARLKNGLLTVSMEKAVEVQPRAIVVQAH